MLSRLSRKRSINIIRVLRPLDRKESRCTLLKSLENYGIGVIFWSCLDSGSSWQYLKSQELNLILHRTTKKENVSSCMI